MRDPRVEQVFERLRVPYEYRGDGAEQTEIGIDDIDPVASKIGQQRLGRSVPEETVDEYTEAYRNGSRFPAITVERGQRGWVILDGLTRFTAARQANVRHMPAYAVQIKDNVVRSILGSAINATNGLPPSRQERVAKAVSDHLDNGVPQADLCKMLSINERTLQQAVEIARTRRKLQTMGINATATPGSVLDALHNHIKSPPVLRRLAEVAIPAHLTADQVADINRRLSVAESEADKLALLDAVAADPDVAHASQARVRQSPVSRSRRQRVVGALHSVAFNCTGASLVDLDLLDPADRAAFRAAVDEAWGAVSAVLNQFPRKESTDAYAHPDVPSGSDAGAPRGARGRAPALSH